MNYETILLTIISIACFWLIVSPSIHTGVFITFGLLLLLIGNIAKIDPAAISQRSYELRLWGAMFILWGVVWKFLIKRFWLRLSCRWKSAHRAAILFGFERRRFGILDRRTKSPVERRTP